MGRLIDTDDLSRYLSYEDAEEMIDYIPTAYDLDGVLEQLEEEMQLAEREKERTVKENPCQFDAAKGYANGIVNAFKIVKGGVKC